MARGWHIGTNIRDRDGRVMWGDEDWGAVVNNGDTLPCCGCEFRGGDNKGTAEICSCKCHQLYRQIHFLNP